MKLTDYRILFIFRTNCNCFQLLSVPKLDRNVPNWIIDRLKKKICFLVDIAVTLCDDDRVLEVIEEASRT